MGWADDIIIALLDKPEYQRRRKNNPQLNEAMTLAEQLKDTLKKDTKNSKNKYHAEKVYIDSICFDSKAEADRYGDLKLLERAGEIADLQIHEKLVFENGVTWKIDFIYTEAGQTVYEDVKGFKTQDYYTKKQCLRFEIVTGIRSGIYREVTRSGRRFHVREYGKDS